MPSHSVLFRAFCSCSKVGCSQSTYLLGKRHARRNETLFSDLGWMRTGHAIATFTVSPRGLGPPSGETSRYPSVLKSSHRSCRLVQ